jgi:hypothetical protein
LCSFFYADLRREDGAPAGSNPNAAAHGRVYLQLAESKDDIPSFVTFTEAKGITTF